MIWPLLLIIGIGATTYCVTRAVGAASAKDYPGMWLWIGGGVLAVAAPFIGLVAVWALSASV